ncbi:hypothetical protein [Oligoflexus tunisiensis]|uniref:hypothetical protein n=1 Tax=Oligoflexus tunisiensis TaxID=708132 RepID=UPI001C406155|nr:hypothetical protein [Oligoflexus tunisiensis]
MNKKIAATGTLVGLLLSSGQAAAMPYYQTSQVMNLVDAQKVASDAVLRTVSIYADHDDQGLLYVSPASRKTQAGQYQISASPVCEILANQYTLVYAVPHESLEEWRNRAKAGPYSAYFDLNFGNYIRQAPILEEMALKISQIDELRKQHPEITSAYEKAKQAWEAAQARYTRADGAIKDYAARLKQQQDQMALAMSPEAIKLIQDEVAAIRKEYEERLPTLREELVAANQEVIRTEAAHATAKGEYDAVVPDETAVQARITTLSTVFDSLNQFATKTYTTANTNLVTLETAAVGTANASYSIWSDEEARLRASLKPGARAAVARLPIFNIRFKEPQQSDKPSSVVPGQMPNVPSLTPSIDNAVSIENRGTDSSTTPLTTGEGVALTVFEKDGKPVQPKTDLYQGAGSGSFTRLITRGAYCTGDSDRKVNIFKVPGEVSSRFKRFDVPVGEYVPRNRNILAQSVALEYDMNLKTDPIAVTCTMDISRFRSWVSQSGNSGFLFWRKKWSKEERTAVDRSGLACNVDISETGTGGSGDTQARLDTIRQAMMQDMAAEFILTYAKSYQFQASQQAVEPNVAAPAQKFGTALQALCGPNVYCQVGAIVLKNGAELFGSTRGSASGQEHISGTISRSYSERAYITKPGEATIDLTVTL